MASSDSASFKSAAQYETEIDSEDSDVESTSSERALQAPGTLVPVSNTENSQQLVVHNPEHAEWQRQMRLVARNRITDDTRKQYNKKNEALTMWMYNHSPDQLKETYLGIFRGAVDSGDNVALLKAISIAVTDRELCPIDPNKFSINTFFTYLLSLRRADGTYYSYSTYDSKRSALMHMYRNEKHSMTNEDKDKLSEYMTSLRKSIASEKREKGIKVKEGKEPMSFKCYKLTCELLIADGSSEALFTLCWLTLQWNLMSRSEATEAISFEQLRYDNDTLKVYFPRMKNDQIGLSKDEARHVYSNPIMPAVCPLRALSSYLLRFPNIVMEHHKLFPGKDQKKRFNRLLNDVFMEHEDKYQANGDDVSDLGSHSIRKGGATYCCAAANPAPPIVSVCLRAGWTLGRVKERYLKYENTGDELVGRTLTGINPSSGEFGISPCFFKVDTDNTFIKNLSYFIFPKQESKACSLIRVILATFIYHEEWTLEHLNKDSPLRDSSYFSFANSYPDRKEYVDVCLPWEKKEGCPTFTGIPFHCSLLNKLIEVHTMQHALPEAISTKFMQELDKRNLGSSSELISQRVMNRVEEIGKELKNALAGVRLEGNKASEQKESQIVVTEACFNTHTLPTETNVTKPVLLFPEKGIWSHFWGGRLRQVPEDFRFDKGKTLLSLWLSWHVPDIARKVCPWKFLVPSDLVNIKRGVTKHREMRVVITRILDAIYKCDELKQRYASGLQDMTALTDVFFKCCHIFKTTSKRESRFAQLSWETFVKDARQMPVLAYKSDGTDTPIVSPTPPSQDTSQPQSAPPSPPRTRAASKRKKATTVSSRRKAASKAPAASKATKAKVPRQRTPRKAKKNTTSTTSFEKSFGNGKIKQIVLKRNAANQFESSPCAFCDSMRPLPTSHRCLAEQKGGMLDGENEICGRPFCAPCGDKWGCEGAPYRCKDHVGNV